MFILCMSICVCMCCVTGNSVQGLEEEESKFLNFVSNRQVQLEREREKEESVVLEQMKISFVCKLEGTGGGWGIEVSLCAKWGEWEQRGEFGARAGVLYARFYR